MILWALTLPTAGIAGILTGLAAPALAAPKLRPAWLTVAGITLAACLLSIPALTQTHAGLYLGS
ncbi:hypothetical protein [Amycolatopsis jiangsuensis]|uniref:hypothetical protein n=1 Tax=Amycolatopsis jiangsuensis TaxID=1181879 RepID=UPI0016145906|nr:hypothetical protein [Amycolatopsis jiangsuensis]